MVASLLFLIMFLFGIGWLLENRVDTCTLIVHASIIRLACEDRRADTGLQGKD